jgi:hypothetical protein
LLANRSSSTTVPLPANLSEDPDDENGGSSNNATAATLSSSIVYTTTDEVVGGEVEVSLPRNDTHHIKLEQRSAEANVVDKDKKKRTRKQRTVTSPLENLVCRGACGSGSDCISNNKQASDTASEKDETLEFLRCENFEGDIKCPLWIGSACALKHHNFKCRLCSLLDAPPPQDDLWIRYYVNLIYTWANLIDR